MKQPLFMWIFEISNSNLNETAFIHVPSQYWGHDISNSVEKFHNLTLPVEI